LEIKIDAYSQNFSHRAFLTGFSSVAAPHSAPNLLPLPPLVAGLQDNSRLSETVMRTGVASVRKVGNGLYAISDPCKVDRRRAMAASLPDGQSQIGNLKHPVA